MVLDKTHHVSLKPQCVELAPRLATRALLGFVICAAAAAQAITTSNLPFARRALWQVALTLLPVKNGDSGQAGISAVVQRPPARVHDSLLEIPD